MLVSMANVHAATPVDASDSPEVAVKVVAKSRLMSVNETARHKASIL